MTRLIWVLVFAVFVGLLLLMFLRSHESGLPIGHRLRQLAGAKKTLAAQYPDFGFDFLPTPSSRRPRRFVVRLTPPHEVSDIERMLDSTLLVISDSVDLGDFDSLVLNLNDSLVRSVPAPDRRRHEPR